MHIFITGASSGIGLALAETLATLPGARLTMVARRRALLEDLAKKVSAPVSVLEADLSQLDGVESVLRRADEAHGPVDVLVNNAGAQIVAPSESVDVASGEASIVLNLFAPLRLHRLVLPSMLARKQGCIVDVASVAALVPTPGMGYYNASKAGLAAASEALRGELRGTGVNVVTVYPGIIDTELAERAEAKYVSNWALRLQPHSTTPKLACAITKAIVAKRARVIHPYFPNIFARYFPWFTRWLMDRVAPRLR